jgi:uncharacterized membrane protein YdbT with pleckstrin-like domain
MSDDSSMNVPEGEPVPPPSYEEEPIDRLRGDRTRDDDREAELWTGSYSPKAMIGTWIGAGLLSVAAILLAVILFRNQFNTTGWLILLGVILAAWLFLLLKLAYQMFNVHYRLTTQRFIHEKGILSRVTDRIEVIDMDDIAYRQGLIDRFVGVGHIDITSSDRTHPHILIRGIDNVKEVAHMMDDARRKERVRRGLHIESI